MTLLSICASLLAPMIWIAAFDDSADQDSTDGVWKAESAEFAGAAFPDEAIKSWKLTLKKDTYLLESNEGNDEGECVVDAKKSPKTMKITGTNGPNKGKTFLAIYERKGETLRVCYDLSGKETPTEFATKKDTRLFLVTYKKAKP